MGREAGDWLVGTGGRGPVEARLLTTMAIKETETQISTDQESNYQPPHVILHREPTR